MTHTLGAVANAMTKQAAEEPSSRDNLKSAFEQAVSGGDDKKRGDDQ